MNKKENRRRLIFSVIVVGLLIWVGSKVKDHLEFQQEMVRIVHSNEVKELIVYDLKQKTRRRLQIKARSNRMKSMMKRSNTIQWEGLCLR